MNTIIQGDIREIAKTLPDESVNCIVTSPPYWGLRDYGTAEWVGGSGDCEHAPGEEKIKRAVMEKSTLNRRKDGSDLTQQFAAASRMMPRDTCPKCGAIRKDNQIGLEATPAEHIAVMVDLFRELRRVLRDDGTLWLNLGDCYATSANGRSAADTKAVGNDDRTFRDKPFSTVVEGLKPKNLVGMPWRIALALQDDGWWLRSDIIWNKTNPMPESVTDRPTRAHEYIFLLTKNARYYYDADAIREPLAQESWGRMERKQDLIDRTGAGTLGKQVREGVEQSHGYSGLALARNGKTGYNPNGRNKRTVWTVNTQPYPEAHFATFPPDLIRPCILAGCPPGGVVFDPFMGSGTVAQVAIETGRNWLGCELNPDYINLAEKRIANTQPALIAPVSSKKIDYQQATF